MRTCGHEYELRSFVALQLFRGEVVVNIYVLFAHDNFQYLCTMYLTCISNVALFCAEPSKKIQLKNI